MKVAVFCLVFFSMLFSSMICAQGNTGVVLSGQQMRWRTMNYSNLDSVLRYKKFELGIVLPDPYKTCVDNFEKLEKNPKLVFAEDQIINPFLEWELDVEGHFMWLDGLSDSASEIVVDGFFTNEIIRNYRKNDWVATPSSHPMRVRFAPPQNGRWSFYITVKVKDSLVATSETIPFNVVESGSLGFTTVHQNHKNLERGGKIIFPVGQNFVAPNFIDGVDPEVAGPGNSKRVPVSAWRRYMDTIQHYINLGGKYIRVNQVVEGNMLEWEKKGNYYGRLHYAWEQDKMLELFEANDVLVLFNLMNQEPMMKYGNYRLWTQDWDHWQVNTTTSEIYYDYADYRSICPYNDRPGEVGGKEPYEMFMNEDDLRYHEQRTRYYLARYGYSTSIYAFELLSEPFHLGQFSEGINENTVGPYLIDTDPDHEKVQRAISNYTNVIGSYVKNHLKHTNQLFMINAVQGTWNPSLGITGVDSSIYSPYVDMIGLNFYSASPKKLLISSIGEPNENGQTKCVADFFNATGKPIFLSESGSGDVSLDCAEGAGETIDAMTFGFTQVAGFNMWHALYANKFKTFENQVKVLQHMNDSITLKTLSEGNGNWVQHRQLERTKGTSQRLKESQYYVSESGLKASGFIRNRTYNVPLEAAENCPDEYPMEGNELYVPKDIVWSDGRKLKVDGLKRGVEYVIEYSSCFEDSLVLPTETQRLGIDGKLTLHHPPLLYGENGLRPIVWFVVYQKPEEINTLK